MSHLHEHHWRWLAKQRWRLLVSNFFQKPSICCRPIFKRSNDSDFAFRRSIRASHRKFNYRCGVICEARKANKSQHKRVRHIPSLCRLLKFGGTFSFSPQTIHSVLLTARKNDSIVSKFLSFFVFFLIVVNLCCPHIVGNIDTVRRNYWGYIGEEEDH